jgi:rubrerythrin
MSDTRLDALKRALQLEAEGMAFYKEAAEKAVSNVGKQMFDYLRKSEDGHIARIKEIHQSLEARGAWPEQVAMDEDMADVRQTIFKAAKAELEATAQIDASDIDALKQAADFERNGEDFYAERAKQVTDPFEKEFYRQLAVEEYHHLEAILDSIQLLEDPQGFFQQQEKGTLAGI